MRSSIFYWGVMLNYLMYNYVSRADSVLTVSSYIPSALCVQSVGDWSSCGGRWGIIVEKDYKTTCDVTVWVALLPLGPTSVTSAASERNERWKKKWGGKYRVKGPPWHQEAPRGISVWQSSVLATETPEDTVSQRRWGEQRGREPEW